MKFLRMGDEIMGFFGGSNEDRVSNAERESNRLADEEIRQNKIQLEQKRQSLYQARLNIIKSQGAQSWNTPKG